MLNKDVCKKCNSQHAAKTIQKRTKEIYNWLRYSSEDNSNIPTTFDLTDIPGHPDMICCIEYVMFINTSGIPERCKYKMEHLIMSNEKLAVPKNVTPEELQQYCKAITGHNNESK